MSEVLQSVALHIRGDKDKAVQILGEALALAEPGGFIRLFVDEGPPMASLLHDANSHAIVSRYTRRLLSAFPPSEPEKAGDPSIAQSSDSSLLSEREIEVLQLIAEGLTNEGIANRLYLSLYTIKAHVRNIFGKLNVTNRTQAVARARELGILQRP